MPEYWKGRTVSYKTMLSVWFFRPSQTYTILYVTTTSFLLILVVHSLEIVVHSDKTDVCHYEIFMILFFFFSPIHTEESFDSDALSMY